MYKRQVNYSLKHDSPAYTNLRNLNDPAQSVLVLNNFCGLIPSVSSGAALDTCLLYTSVEPLIDMGRTALNVSDSMVAGVTASNAVGGLDRAMLRDPEARVSGEGHTGL